MTTRKVLWFGPPKPGSEMNLMRLGLDYSLEYLPLPVKTGEKAFFEKFAAGVICHSSGQGNVFRLLRQLRSVSPQIPLIVLSEDPSKSDLLEAFRSGATDCLEEPIGTEELFTHLIRYINPPKANTIQALLQELGKKISERVYASQCSGIASSSFLSMNDEQWEQPEAINVNFFGQFDITINGISLAKDLSFRERSLLAYLVFHHGRAIHRDRLLRRFWMDSSADSAKNSLHVAIAGIRRILESACPDYQYITCQKQMYSFKPDLPVSTDVGSFLLNFQQALSFERFSNTEEALYAYHRAFSYYRDVFLGDLEGADWVQDERDRLQEKYIVILKTLGEHFVHYGQHDFAIILFNKILEVDDCYELAHRLLIGSYLAKGMKDQALRQFKKCREMLWQSLEIKPSRATQKLFELMRR